MGGQASWLLPAALLALFAGLWARRRAPRTDRTRAALLLWGGWLFVTALVFSFGQGVIHTYYTVALAPAIGALVAIGAAQLWSRRETLSARLLAALALAGSAAWSCALLARTPSWEPWLAPTIAITAALAVLGLLATPRLGGISRRVGIGAAVLGIVAILAGPLAYAAQTITTAHTGSIPSAGPASASAGGPGGGPGGGAHGFAGTRPGGAAPGARTSGSLTGTPPGLFAGGQSGGGAPAAARGGAPAAGAGSRTAGAGGVSSSVSAALVKALRYDAGAYRWVAATSGSQSAAGIELASGEPVMAIGGFNGQGGNLSLMAFERYVSKGEIHYYVAAGGGGAGGGGAPGGGDSSTTITSWVEAHFKAETIGGETVYVLSPSS